MASFLIMLTATASEEPVHMLDQGQALRDAFAAHALDTPPAGRWTVNERGREILADWGLDRPVAVRTAEALSTATTML